MTAVLARATHRVERYRRQNSDAVRLTRLASLAVRVEPYLLRRLRLELLPELDVGTEADVWFGPLVESRGTDAIVLDPHAADVLRDDLATDRELLRQVRHITRDSHQNSPPAIRLEEEVNALALLNEGNVVAAIDETLRPAIRAICKGGDPAQEIAHWARRALARVHPTVRRSQGWALLRLASDSILGTAPLMKTPDADVNADALAWILPTTALSERVSLGVELVQRGLRFISPVAGTPALDLPRTDPLLVELEWGSARRRTKRLVEAEIGRTLDLEDDVSEVTLRTLAGDEYVLERADTAQTAGSRVEAARPRTARHFESDVFISYAHIDDQPLIEGQPGWISSLHRALEVRLAQLLGKETRIWRDPKLQGNDVFSDSLLDRMQSVAVFIAVVSPRYIRSEWCQRELREFVTAAETTGGLRVYDKARVFKVLKTSIPLEQHPPDLKSFLGYEFFTFDPGSGRVSELDSMSASDRQRDYWLKLDDLAHDIADMLTTLADPASAPQSESDPSKAVVYLAETSADLREQREAIKRDLVQYGHTVLPYRPLPLTARECEAFVREQLSLCKLSVHLIGENYGVVPDESAESIVVLQKDLASERAGTGDFHTLIWMPPNLSTADDRQQRFIERLEKDAGREPAVDIVRTPFKDFTTELQVRLNPIEATAMNERPSPGPVEAKRTYLICDQRDLEAVRPLMDLLFEKCEVTLPVFEGDEAEIRGVHEDNLVECDAVLVYYGAGSELWLRSKLRELEKVAGYGRTRPMLAKAVYVAPPDTPEKSRFQSHNAIVIHGGGVPNSDALAPFLEKLADSGG